MSGLELNPFLLLTLSVHAQEGYSSCPVSLSVCLSVCHALTVCLSVCLSVCHALIVEITDKPLI